MPSTLRSFAIRTMPLVALAVAPTTLGAQRSAELTVPVRIVVPPSLVIRSVVPGAVRTESPRTVVATAFVNVESNLPYRLSVRLAQPRMGSRAFVRNADGTFESLDGGVWVTAITHSAPGHQSHEIVCRVEGTTADGCALVYELSAEYHDRLIRTTASLCNDCGLRTADSRLGKPLPAPEASRGF